MHGGNKGWTYLNNPNGFSLSVYDILLPPCIMRLIITFSAELIILYDIFTSFSLPYGAFVFIRYYYGSFLLNILSILS